MDLRTANTQAPARRSFGTVIPAFLVVAMVFQMSVGFVDRAFTPSSSGSRLSTTLIAEALIQFVASGKAQASDPTRDAKAARGPSRPALARTAHRSLGSLNIQPPAPPHWSLADLPPPLA
ncbi:MAG: hypothetical protein AABZ53_17255 [Planctomycetota bacterium]